MATTRFYKLIFFLLLPGILFAKNELLHCGMEQKMFAAQNIGSQIDHSFNQLRAHVLKKHPKLLNKHNFVKIEKLSNQKLGQALEKSSINMSAKEFRSFMNNFKIYVLEGKKFALDPNTLDMRSYCHAACCSYKNFKCGKTHVQTKCHTKSYPEKCATYCHKRCKDHSRRTCGVKTHCGWYHHHHHRYYKCHTHKDCHDHHYRTCLPHCATHCHKPRSHECQFKLPGGAWQPCKLSPMKKWEIATLVAGITLAIATEGMGALIDADLVAIEGGSLAADAAEEGSIAGEEGAETLLETEAKEGLLETDYGKLVEIGGKILKLFAPGLIKN